MYGGDAYKLTVIVPRLELKLSDHVLGALEEQAVKLDWSRCGNLCLEIKLEKKE